MRWSFGAFEDVFFSLFQAISFSFKLLPAVTLDDIDAANDLTVPWSIFSDPKGSDPKGSGDQFSIHPESGMMIDLIWLVVLRHPSEKYEFVSWDYDIPNWMGKIKHVPNH